jgi:hypothetical protein
LTLNRVITNIAAINTSGETMNARPADLPFDDVERLYVDDPDDDIDWDELIAELPEDILSEPYAFSTRDYPTPEEGMAALWKFMCTLGNGGSDENSDPGPDSPRAP